MPPVERSVADVFKDIVRNLQDIMRAEVRLAKTELRNEIGRFQGGALALGIGALASVFALLFVLLAAATGLAEVVPYWAASLVVALALMVCAAVAITAGLKRLKRVRIAPETVESLKENTEWAKRQIK